MDTHTNWKRYLSKLLTGLLKSKPTFLTQYTGSQESTHQIIKCHQCSNSRYFINYYTRHMSNYHFLGVPNTVHLEIFTSLQQKHLVHFVISCQ